MAKARDKACDRRTLAVMPAMRFVCLPTPRPYERGSPKIDVGIP